MPDPIPAPQEATVIPPKPEAKPAAAPKPKETPSTPSDADVSRLKSAHGTLEKIAQGVPVAEATAPPESAPDREAQKAILREANAILLDLRDLRLWASAVASQAAETPLGDEVRADALRSLQSTDAPELAAVREKITALNLPKSNPAESATVKLLSTYNEQHPEQKVPDTVMEAVKTGSKDASTAVSGMLQSNPDLAALTWKELTGQENLSQVTPSPERMLQLAGIEASEDNLKKAREMFGIAQKQAKEPIPWGQNIVMGVMYGSLILQFFSSIALGENHGGGH